MRWARMWNRMSPGVAIAWRIPDPNSRNGCNSAGRGAPNSRSQTCDPNAMTQDKLPSRSRNPTARNRALRSAHTDRAAVSASGPGSTVTTRKIAARVSSIDNSCVSARGPATAPGTVIRLDSIVAPRDARSPSVRLARSRTGRCVTGPLGASPRLPHPRLRAIGLKRRPAAAAPRRSPPALPARRSRPRQSRHP